MTHLTESYIVKWCAFADHAPFLLWLYRTIHVEYRQLLLRHNRKGAWSANADDFTIISESCEGRVQLECLQIQIRDDINNNMLKLKNNFVTV